MFQYRINCHCRTFSTVTMNASILYLRVSNYFVNSHYSVTVQDSSRRGLKQSRGLVHQTVQDISPRALCLWFKIFTTELSGKIIHRYYRLLRVEELRILFSSMYAWNMSGMISPPASNGRLQISFKIRWRNSAVLSTLPCVNICICIWHKNMHLLHPIAGSS